MEFENGTVVKTVCNGGPRMYISAKTKNGRYECHWWDKDGKIQWDTFSAETIKISETSTRKRIDARELGRRARVS